MRFEFLSLFSEASCNPLKTDKFLTTYTVKAHWGSGGMTALILNLRMCVLKTDTDIKYSLLAVLVPMSKHRTNFGFMAVYSGLP